MSVRETLELDISEALSAIEQVGDRLANVAQAFGEVLSDSLQQALDGLPVITPEVDFESVSSEVEQALTDATAEEQTVTIDADTTGVAAEVDAALGDVDATVEVTVEADTSQASQAVEQLGDSLDGAGGAGEQASVGLGQAAVTTGLLARGASGASGVLGRATGALSALGPAGVAAGIGVGAAATSAGFLYDAAFQSVSVTQQWENSLGDLGARIEDLGSGTTGFSTNLRQLAQDVGSSDEAVLIATQRYVEFQRSAGFADDQIVENSQNLAVLAAQVRTNNPELGSMDQIINALSRSLQRGGPRLQAYGVSLDTTAIQQRALRDSGKETAEELTNAELSAAGLSLAMEQLNPNVKSVEDGMENVSIKADRAREKLGDALETVGAPLVEPITEAFLQLAIAFESVAGFAAEVSAAIGTRLSRALDGIGTVLRPLAGAVSTLADNLGFFEDAAEGSADGVDLLADAIDGLARNAIGSIPILGPWINAIGDLNDALGGAADEAEDAEDAIRNTGIAEADAAKITNEFWLSVERTRNELAAAEADIVAAYQALTTFADTARSNIPTVVSAFAELNDESNADTLSGNLTEQIRLTDQWTADMARLFEEGYDDIAVLLSELGPEQSALLVEQYAGREQELEKHLEQVAAAHQRANAKVNEIAVRGYLDLRGITEQQANAVVLQLGASLQLGVPAQEAIDQLIDAPSTRQLEIIAAYRQMGSDSAGAVGEDLNSATGTSIAYNFIDGVTKGLYLRRQEAIDSARDAAVNIVRTVNGIFGNSSPSKVMEQSGRDLIAGLVLGIGGSAPDAERAMAGLASDVLGVSLSAGAPTVRDVSVTVPVTVSGGMTAEDGRAIGEAAGRAAGVELARMMRLEARVS